MRMRLKVFSILTLIVMVCAGPAAFADENQVVALQNQVQSLNEKVAQLEGLVRSIQAGQVEKTAAPAYVGTGSEDQGGFLRAAQDINVSGYVDTQYSLALNDATDHRTPAGGINSPTNRGRVFDQDQDSFTLNAAEIDIAKEANPEGGAGFRMDIQYGEDAEVVDFDATTAGLAATQDELHLQQAYVEYVQPLSFWADHDILPGSVNIKAGRFVTLAGLEVIEARDNWNISRSYAFGMALPFTHTGVRTNFKMFRDAFDVYLGLNNGWDVGSDNNRGKTGELGLGYKLMENLSFFHAVYFGPERNDTGGHKRFLITNVASYDLTDKFSVKGEVNYGNERRVGGTASPIASLGENIEFSSYAGYGRYQLTDNDAIAYRAELFRDDAGSRAASSGLFPGGFDNTLFEQTLTYERVLASNLIGRLEYRWDKANNSDIYDLDSNQQTLGGQLIYSFA